MDGRGERIGRKPETAVKKGSVKRRCSKRGSGDKMLVGDADSETGTKGLSRGRSLGRITTNHSVGARNNIEGVFACFKEVKKDEERGKSDGETRKTFHEFDTGAIKSERDKGRYGQGTVQNRGKSLRKQGWGGMVSDQLQHASQECRNRRFRGEGGGARKKRNGKSTRKGHYNRQGSFSLTSQLQGVEGGSLFNLTLGVVGGDGGEREMTAERDADQEMAC